jgi:ligand-binding sensor domain-containing protein
MVTAAQSSTFVDFQEVRLEANGERFNTFFSIAQDQEGYLWFGTNNGLVRYDGLEAKVYRNKASDSTSIGGHRLLDLGDNPILLLYVDSQNALWAGTTNDLSRYEKHCDCFSHYHLPLAEGRINAITEDQNNNLWVGGQGEGLYQYNRESDQFIAFLNHPEDSISLNKAIVNVLLTDQHNNIWIGLWNKDLTTGGLIRYHATTGIASVFYINPKIPIV